MGSNIYFAPKKSENENSNTEIINGTLVLPSVSIGGNTTTSFNCTVQGIDYNDTISINGNSILMSKLANQDYQLSAQCQTNNITVRITTEFYTTFDNTQDALTFQIVKGGNTAITKQLN